MQKIFTRMVVVGIVVVKCGEVIGSGRNVAAEVAEFADGLTMKCKNKRTVKD